MRSAIACVVLVTCACLFQASLATHADKAEHEGKIRNLKLQSSPGQKEQEAAAVYVRADKHRIPEKGSPLDLVAAPVLNKAEISATEEELATKLRKMKELIYGIHSGVDKSSRLRATSMKHKFNKLSSVIAALAEQKDSLFRENVKLRREMKSTVERLQRVETQLKLEAKRADDNDVKRWFEAKSVEIADFLHSNGLQNYADPKFSPVVAGLVTYSLVLLPLMAASGYVTRHIKALSLLHALKAINIFEVGYVGISLLSMPLLLTMDPFHALRHISDINFIFLQIVLACLFWASTCILVAESIRSRAPGVRRNLIIELILRLGLALDYGRRVWAPVVERADEAVIVKPEHYVGYAVATLLAHRLTSNAGWWAAARGAPPHGREIPVSAVAPVVQWGNGALYSGVYDEAALVDTEASTPGFKDSALACGSSAGFSSKERQGAPKTTVVVNGNALATMQRILPRVAMLPGEEHAD